MKAPIVKKVPMRKCVITGNQFPKKDLLRVVREPDGKDADVIITAKKKHILDRFLEVAVADEIYDELLKKVSQSE